MLCRTGLVWKSVVDGKLLTFRLVGLNNQNFIMQDEQTGTWWQQVTGEALYGPLEGRKLERMMFEQLTFETWARENPEGTVLESREEFAELYWKETEREETRDGERIAFPVDATEGDVLERGELVAAVEFGDRKKAYPMRLLREQSPIADFAFGSNVLVVLATDERSVRCFNLELGEETLELFRKPDEDTLVLVDPQTGSEWDFTGTAISGPLKGQTLERLPLYTDYWFDFKKFYPNEPVYRGGDF